jgi:putative aldouronate transport system permease protein
MFFSGGLIPTYMWIRQLGLINNRLVLILPGIAAYYLIIMRNFFMGMPVELQEAAQIDGADDLTLWWKIVLPLSMPIIATIALWTAVNHWNAYFDALIYMTDKSKYVLQILLRRVLIDTDLINMGMQPGQGIDIAIRPTEETVKAALLIVTTVPILAVYPFAQKYFIKGILQGSIKG